MTVEIDERIYEIQRVNDRVTVTCDRKPVALRHDAAKVPTDTVPDWGLPLPPPVVENETFEERFAYLKEPRPGVDLLALTLAMHVVGTAATPAVVAAMRSYLLQLPPPSILAYVRVRGQDLRMAVGMPPPSLPPVAAPQSS